MPQEFKNKILRAVALFLITITIGVVGYMIVAPGSTVLSALYMTIITLTTVGYGEVIDLTNNPAGKLFTMALIMFGMGNLLFVVSTLTSIITDGELREILRKRRMLKMIEQINDHIVVCGQGIICRRIIQELIETKRDFVFVTDCLEETRLLVEKYPDILHIEGDSSHNDTLLQAGIKNAHGLIVALPDDRDSLLTIVTAKNLNPKVRIVASVTDPEVIEKFKAVGVETIVSPTLIGGLRIVSEMIRPSVTTFLDVMLRDKSSNTRFEGVDIGKGSRLIDKTLRDSRILEETGLVVLSLQKSEKDGFIYNPSQEEVIKEGMSVIVIGSVDQVGKLREMAK